MFIYPTVMKHPLSAKRSARLTGDSSDQVNQSPVPALGCQRLVGERVLVVKTRFQRAVSSRKKGKWWEVPYCERGARAGKGHCVGGQSVGAGEEHSKQRKPRSKGHRRTGLPPGGT